MPESVEHCSGARDAYRRLGRPGWLAGGRLVRAMVAAGLAQRLDGEVVMPPVSQNCWFLYGEGNGTTEENQLGHMRAVPGLGVEVEWLDAGWFEGGWPNGVGSWVPRTDFNLQPLPYWQEADEPAPQGITENHYIEPSEEL